jgi:predicted aldo/keto reductase-like oxidoreductase
VGPCRCAGWAGRARRSACSASDLGEAKDEAEAIRIVHAAIDHGVTFLDNCWDYHEGKSERWMGAALRGGKRQRVVLMSKIDGQTRESAARQIDESLQRLGTDVIDLMQVHEVIREGDPERVFSAGGIEAMLRAKEQGKIRFIGFTGHKDPAIHRRMIEKGLAQKFVFDTVQMPLNVMDAHFLSFEKEIVPLAQQHDMGILGMKPFGGGAILKSKAASPLECLRYSMSLPTSVEQALPAAMTHKPMNEGERASLLSRTAPHAAKGEHERFKTSDEFDGTKRHPEWLG